MGTNPTVTALVANYNYGHYILDAINGLKNQTYKCNLAIGDDASTDDSWKIICGLFDDPVTITLNDEHTRIRKDEDVAFQLKTQAGPSHTRNLLIQETLDNTDYYLIADADDIALPTKVEKFVKVMEENPLVGIVYANYNILNVDTGNILTEFKEPFSHPKLLQECIIHSNAMIRKTVLQKCFENTGWFDFRLRCAEDYDLWLRACDNCLAYHIAEPLTTVRVHKQNSTNTVHNNIWQQCWQLVQQKFQQKHAKS